MLRYMLLGAGVVFLAAVLAIASCVLLVKRVGDAELTPVVDGYFARVANADYAGAYADFGAPLRATTSAEQYAAFERTVHARLGQVERARSLVQVQEGSGTEGTWAVASYESQFDQGSARVTFRFQKVDGRWEIIGVNYSGPALEGVSVVRE